MRRSRTAMLAACVLLVAVVAAFAVSLAVSQSESRDDIEARFSERAKLSAALTESVFGSSSGSAAAQNAKLFGGDTVSPALLSRLAARNRSANLLVLDRHGVVIASSAKTSVAARRAIGRRPDYVRQALSGAPYALSNVLWLGFDAPVIEFAQPFKTPYGTRVVVSGFRPSALYSFFGGYLRKVPNAGGNAYVLDANGAVVGTPARGVVPGARVGEPGLLTAMRGSRRGDFGSDRYFAAGAVHGSPWHVVLTAPKDQLFAPVRGARKWVPWSIVLAFALAGGWVLLLMRRGIRRSAELRSSQERYELAVRGANDGIWDRDFVNDTLYLSPRWKEIIGMPADFADSREAWIEQIHPDDVERMVAAAQAHMRGETPTFEHEARMFHSDGSGRWVLVRGVATRDADGNVTRMAGSLSDITERKVAEEQLRQDALHDALTGLANRALFLDRLAKSLARARRSGAHGCAVLFLDLDQFKLINDSFSHTVGDGLLVELGRRLTSMLRPGDTVARGGPERTIARLGGDEFTILLDEVSSVSTAVEVAERIVSSLEEPFLVHNRMVFVTASVGIAMSDPAITPGEMMRNADLAMYDAKRQGKNRYSVYTEQMHELVTDRLDLELELRRSIEDRTLRVFYQPIIHLDTGELSGFEALARWPEGLPPIVPDVFIPVAEDTGLIVPLCRLVLETACAQLAAWRSSGQVAAGVTMSVNVAGCQLNEPEVLIEDVRGALAASGLPAACLRLELTEGTLISDPDRVRDTLDTLAAIGVHAHIDDFGTGYSSLTFLQYFPGDTLKIDRSFISTIHEDSGHHEIVRAITSLAANLGLETIAEGIDDPAQLGRLRDLGVQYGQGFRFAEPLDAEHALEAVGSWGEAAAGSAPVVPVVPVVD